MHYTNDQFSDQFNNGLKKIKITDLLRFFGFYVNNLTLWARELEQFFMYACQIVVHVTNDQFSDKFNNGSKKFKMTDLLRF